FLAFLFYRCVELITVKTPQKQVNVTTGGTVLLQCTFVTTQETTSLNIQWEFVSSADMKTQQVVTRYSLQAKYVDVLPFCWQVYYYQAGKDVISTAFEGRLTPPSAPATSRNASILISNMKPSDAGVYTCDVHNFPDVEGQSQVNIIVNVLGKLPSVPYCSVHGDVESGHLVTLTCHSEHGSPKPKYTWIRLDETKARRPVMGRSEYSTESGILEIRNISEFQFGEYQCNASNVVGFSICTVELSPDILYIHPFVLIGALLGCVLIILVVWFIAHTVKRKKYKAVNVSEDLTGEEKCAMFRFLYSLYFNPFMHSGHYSGQLFYSCSLVYSWVLLFSFHFISDNFAVLDKPDLQ
uniref:V-set and immunoglobulin domain-containing protein 1 n=1 Tax=Sphaeramia orbicularis TaxID=375764 RepID=A0A673BAI3_9TELE